MPNDFSVQLPTEQQGKQIIGPMGTRGGFLGGLSDFASGLINADVHRVGQRDQMNEQARRESTQAALDEVAVGYLKSLESANDQLHPIRPEDTADLVSSGLTAPNPPSVTATALPDIPGTNVAAPPAGFENGVPPDVARAARDLNQVQIAVSQGRASQATLDLRLENVVNDTIARHPDAAAEILTFLHSQGLTHSLYQDVQNQMDTEEARRRQLQQSADAQVNYAVTHGLGSATTDSYEVLAQRGQRGMALQAEAQALQAQQEANERALRLGNMTREAADHARGDTAQSVLQNAFAVADQYLSPIIQDWTTLAASADIEQTGRLDAMRQTITGNLEASHVAARAAVARAGGPHLEANIQAVDNYYQGYQRMMENVVSGDSSRFRANVRALEATRTQLHLQGRRQLQMYTFLSDTFGQGTVNAMFNDGILSHVPPAMMTQLANELAGFTASNDENSATIHMAHIAQILRGNASLQDVPEAQRAAIIGTLTPTATTANGLVVNALATGQPVDPQVLQGGLNASTGVIDAITSIQPGTTRIDSAVTASRFIGNRNFRTAVIAGINNPTTHDQALAVMTGGRAAAARLHSILRPQALAATDTATGVLRVEYFADQHRYRVVADRSRYAQYVARMGNLTGMGGPVPTGMGGRLGGNSPPLTFEEIQSRGDRRLQDMSDALNGNIGMLANTRQYDSHQPLQSLSFEQSVDYWATGVLPPAVSEQMRTAGEGPNLLNQQIDALETRIADMPNHVIANPESRVNLPQSATEYQPHVTSSAARYGIPAEGLAAVIGQESGWDPLARGTVTPSGQSAPPDVVGLGQFLIPRTAARGQTLAETRRGSAAARYGLIDVDDQGNITRDDRTNPQMAIEATAHYLSDLHTRLGSWGAALDAYGVTAESNGPGMAALRRRLLQHFGETSSE